MGIRIRVIDHHGEALAQVCTKEGFIDIGLGEEEDDFVKVKSILCMVYKCFVGKGERIEGCVEYPDMFGVPRCGSMYKLHHRGILGIEAIHEDAVIFKGVHGEGNLC